MTERRAVLGWCVAALGLAAAVVAVVLDAPALALAAGAAAVLAGAGIVWLARRLREVEERLRDMRSEVAAWEQDRARQRLRSESGDLGPADPATARDALTDPITGLLNDRYFRVALDGRISAARRHLRPVAVVLIEVVEGLQQQAPTPVEAMVVGQAISRTLRDADTACRLDDGRFALLLEDTPETGAVWTVERLRRNLVPDHPGYTMWAGVACYPAHAFTPDEMLGQASVALESAKEWRQDRIEVATPTD